MKTIFLVGNWKSGTTLAQFYLAKDKNIFNFFPDKTDKGDYDGTNFWMKYGCHIQHKKWGNYIRKEYFDRVDKQLIMSDLNNRFDDKCKFGLLKRPQFVLNIEFIKWLFDNNVHIIGIKRDLIPTIYSYIRANKAWGQKDGFEIKIGLHPPKWINYIKSSVIEFAVWTYLYTEEIFKKYDMPVVKYEDICDKQNYARKQISDIINYDLNISYEKIKNLNDAYKTGTILVSRNRETCKGNLNIGSPSKIELPPLTNDEIKQIKDIYNKMKGSVDISV